MYSTLLVLHSFFRWFLLLALLSAIYRAYQGYVSDAVFAKADNAFRHWTATISHIQLTIGFILYFKSPVVKYFWADFKEGVKQADAVFFGLAHISLMLAAVVLLTVGSALAKRKKTDKEKFKTMFACFFTALLLILTAVPWPFSPFSNRPYFRPF